ncbi:MAG: type II toxin-antitoxin system VapC family toxin [Dermatophilus congolensis]|nr:type II toxin-antitoxin system VapC family toxin [Dermatophilus congolensis]
MILYVDTSALVPLLIEEESSASCGELWDSADTVTTTRLAYVEAVAAVAQAARLGRISLDEAAEAREVLEELWSAIDIIELDRVLMMSAAGLAVSHGLRGYDATHCAAAIAINDAELVAATGGRQLLAAWRAEGVATWNANT